jgi:hypothetical protein
MDFVPRREDVVVYGSKDRGIGTDLVGAFYEDEMLDASAQSCQRAMIVCIPLCLPPCYAAATPGTSFTVEASSRQLWAHTAATNSGVVPAPDVSRGVALPAKQILD